MEDLLTFPNGCFLAQLTDFALGMCCFFLTNALSCCCMKSLFTLFVKYFHPYISFLVKIRLELFLLNQGFSSFFFFFSQSINGQVLLMFCNIYFHNIFLHQTIGKGLLCRSFYKTSTSSTHNKTLKKHIAITWMCTLDFFRHLCIIVFYSVNLRSKVTSIFH